MYISNEDLFWAYKEEKNLLESKRVYTIYAVKIGGCIITKAADGYSCRSSSE